MKDKITRLSKGITDIEAPVMRIVPEFFSDTVYSGRSNSFALELASDNNTAVKGICFCDDPRISAEPKAFAGRRVHLSVRADAKGLAEGDRIRGELVLVTNGGERRLPYDFEVKKQSVQGLRADFSGNGSEADSAENAASESKDTAAELRDCELRRNPLSFEVYVHAAEYTSEGQKEQLEVLCSELPEDEPLFEGVLSALIRSGNTSEYAFLMYGEAIRRGINITGLYESYVYAYPPASEEPMPREVLIYFSYETDAEHTILKKLYRNILLYTDRESELYMHYERAISNYAVNNALNHVIDDQLAVIYDRMIYPGMIDLRAAELLPDIFKCSRIELKTGAADYLTVSYSGLNRAVRSDITAGVCFVPVYFADARLRFYRFSGAGSDEEVTDSVSFDNKPLFERPDILRRCFELMPEHEMLLLSAAREIAERGLNSEDEIAVVSRAFTELNVSSELRQSLINRLCDFGSASEWIGSLIHEADYASPVGRRLFSVLCAENAADLPEALKLIESFGADGFDIKDTAAVISSVISAGRVPCSEEGVSPYFAALAKHVFDSNEADDVICRFLAAEYEGGSEDMYELMQSLDRRGLELGSLPEKILSVKLFADSKEHIDETFSIYITRCEYTELILRAYLTVRCADAFLHEEQVDGIVYDALRSYARGASEPLNLPLIYRLALTAYYTDAEELDSEETALCSKLTDDLIAMGLIFRYTKKLRKKIAIPEEICSRFYVQFNAAGNETPKLITRILPDNEEYRVTDMQRVYKNIFVCSTVLFKGDELQYIIYNNDHEENAAAEGIISVKKYHRQRDAVFASLDTMTRACEDKDIELLKETMLEYAERTETVKLLFDLEK